LAAPARGTAGRGAAGVGMRREGRWVMVQDDSGANGATVVAAGRIAVW
jgi:hypothetical protein